MKSIIETINTIDNEAQKRKIEAIWDLVSIINHLLDDAYRSGLSGYYSSALECASEAVRATENLCAMLKETSEQPLRENIRDALGSIKFDKFEFPVGMRKGIDKMISDANKARVLYVCDTKSERFYDEDDSRLVKLLRENKLTGAMRYRNGKAYTLNMEEKCWEFDSNINISVRPDLAKYC